MNIITKFLKYFLSAYVLLLPSLVMGNGIYLPSDAGSSAQMIGKGYVEGFSPGAASVFENPAGIQRTNSGGFTLYTTSLMDEVHYKNIAIVSLTSLGKIGFGYFESSVSGLTSTIDNTTTGRIEENYQFGLRIANYKLAYKYTFSDSFTLGGALSYFSTNYDTYTGTGINADLGAIYDAENWSMSLFGRNLLDSSITYNDGKSSTISKELIASFKVPWESYDFYYQVKQKDDVNLNSYGLTYDFFGDDVFHLSLGRRDLVNPNGGIEQSLTAGIDLNVYEISFSVAYEKSKYIENNNKIYWSTGMEF